MCTYCKYTRVIPDAIKTTNKNSLCPLYSVYYGVINESRCVNIIIRLIRKSIAIFLRSSTSQRLFCRNDVSEMRYQRRIRARSGE